MDVSGKDNFAGNVPFVIIEVVISRSAPLKRLFLIPGFFGRFDLNPLYIGRVGFYFTFFGFKSIRELFCWLSFFFLFYDGTRRKGVLFKLLFFNPVFRLFFTPTFVSLSVHSNIIY